LRYRVIACDEERLAARSARDVGRKGTVYGHVPKRQHAQNREKRSKVICREYKGENHVARNCDNY